jgi:hypothetical protein
MSERPCCACRRVFDFSNGQSKFCPECQLAKFPIVYRFICPDGRSYVGSVADGRNRISCGISRSNSRLLAAFEQYPPESWVYEILEQLPPGCSERKLRNAEQRHIDRLRSWDPAVGFNMQPAVWNQEGPSQQAARRRQAEINRAWQAKHPGWNGSWRLPMSSAATSSESDITHS